MSVFEDGDGYPSEEQRALLPYFPEMLSWDKWPDNRDEIVSWIFATVDRTRDTGQ